MVTLATRDAGLLLASGKNDCYSKKDQKRITLILIQIQILLIKYVIETFFGITKRQFCEENFFSLTVRYRGLGRWLH